MMVMIMGGELRVARRGEAYAGEMVIPYVHHQMEGLPHELSSYTYRHAMNNLHCV